jgi:hypothetical protein
VQLAEKVKAAPNDGTPAAAGRSQSQAAQISDPHRRAVNESRARRNAAGADHAIAFDRNDRLMFWSLNRCRGEVVGLPFQRHTDPTRHRILSEQTPESRVMVSRGQFETNGAVGPRVLGRDQLA